MLKEIEISHYVTLKIGKKKKKTETKTKACIQCKVSWPSEEDIRM